MRGLNEQLATYAEVRDAIERQAGPTQIRNGPAATVPR